MALERISMNDFENRYIESCIFETCIECLKEKPIPMVRVEKRCDDCIEKSFKAEQEKTKQAEKKQFLDYQRIPERFRNFDISKLECGSKLFEEYCESGQSLSISGIHGTGKTNLACQILIQRRVGQYYHISELFKFDMDKIQSLNLILIDDLSKFDVTNEKKMEKLFELLNYRYNQLLDTIITSDYTYDELEKYFGTYGTALVSRMRQWMLPITLKKQWR